MTSFYQRREEGGNGSFVAEATTPSGAEPPSGRETGKCHPKVPPRTHKYYYYYHYLLKLLTNCVYASFFLSITTNSELQTIFFGFKGFSSITFAIPDFRQKMEGRGSGGTCKKEKKASRKMERKWRDG